MQKQKKKKSDYERWLQKEQAMEREANRQRMNMIVVGVVIAASLGGAVMAFLVSRFVD